MLHILLLILKILGVILLVLFCLLLTVLLLLLFVPVRYRLQGKYGQEIWGRVKVNWLLHILSVRLVCQEQAVLTVKIFGIPVIRRQVWPGEPEDQEFFGEDSEPSTVRMASVGGPDEDLLPEELPTEEFPAKEFPARELPEENLPPEDLFPDDLPQENILKEREPPDEKPASEQPSSGLSADGQPPDDRPGETPPPDAGPVKRLYDRICSWFSDKFSKLKDSIKNIRRSLKHAERKIRKLQEFWNNQENQKTFRLLIRQTKRLLKHLLPRKIKGRICFGFEDPYYTGQVLTAVSPFYGLYAKDLSLEPVFGEPALEGEMEIRGYLRLGTLAFIVLRVLVNKNFRILLKKWRS